MQLPEELLGSTSCHRVALFDQQPDDARPRVRAIISQSDVVRALQARARDLEDLAARPVLSLLPAQQGVFSVLASTPAIDAFARMHEAGLSAAAVVTDRESQALVANLSISDLRGIPSPESFGVLAMPCIEFLMTRRHQASARQELSTYQSSAWEGSSDGSTSFSLQSFGWDVFYGGLPLSPNLQLLAKEVFPVTCSASATFQVQPPSPPR